MTDESKEKLGLLIDKLDNFAHGLEIPMPDRLHVQAFKEAMPDIVKEFKESFVEITGENPWEY